MTARTILFVSHTGEWGGGGEVVLQQTMRAAHEAGYATSLVCPPGALAAHVAPFGRVDTLPIPWLRRTLHPTVLAALIGRWLVSIVYLARLVRRSDVALVHANSGVAALVASIPATVTGRPLIWHQHDIIPPRPINRLLLPLCARLCSLLIATSETVAASLINLGVPRSRIRVLYPRLRAELVAASMPHKSAARATLGLETESAVLVLIGRLVARKGHMDFLGAIELLLKAGHGVHGLIVGSAPSGAEPSHDSDYPARLRSRMARPPLAGHVTLLEHRSDIGTVLSAADILLVPSTAEPFGIVILEAFANGLPVVAAAAGGPTELIEPRATGLLTIPGDPVDLARAVEALLSDPGLAHRMVAAARDRVFSEFSEAGLPAELDAMYRCLLDGDRQCSGAGATPGVRWS